MLKTLCNKVAGLNTNFEALHKNMKFSIKDFSSKCDQIRIFLQIWSHLLEQSLIKKLYFLCSEEHLQTAASDIPQFPVKTLLITQAIK